jgi:hypothetical protein
MGFQELLIAASAAAISTGLGAFLILPFKNVKEKVFRSSSPSPRG